MYKTADSHPNYTPGSSKPLKKPSIPTAYMAEHKSSHKGGCTGSQISSDPEEGPTDKNKTRLKYRNSIPLQEYQTLAKSVNLKNHKPNNGNSPRPSSRAQSEASDITSECDASLTRTHIQLERELSLGKKTNSPNP